VLAEALDARSWAAAGGHEELPVGRLEQEQFASELLGGGRWLPEEWGGAPLAAVHLRPGPLRVRVEPGAMVSPVAPGALGKVDVVDGWVGFDEGGRGGEVDGGVGGESADRLGEELHAFEPPVAEELGVVGGHHDPCWPVPP
jgi:hypothetical protein